MKVRAQIGMVLNLDKCIGCHTCSITCKNVWTSREGVEYAWFNNVETKPGVGVPKEWENQEKWNGGWERTKKGKLRLKMGGKLRILANIFANPDLPQIDDYYEPIDFDYQHLHTAGDSKHQPVARPRSLITGKRMEKIECSPNSEEIIGTEFEKRKKDVNFNDVVQKDIYGQFEKTFMMYLPRLCEHCLNPACMAACPSGAIYKREEDGIVLIDQDRCRGWRQCVTGCPYKKVYFNHRTGKAEKCHFCYPRIEVGLPTVCSETCVGRLRYIGIVFYDADRVTEAAAVEDPKDLYEAQLDIMLDPRDPEVIAAARANGIADDWIEAAQKSPIYALCKYFKVALPLHPEYRTMPMVWYIPPLSPVVDLLQEQGHDAEAAGNLFGAIDALRIPVEYLAELFTAGDSAVVTGVLQKLAAMRAYMRDITLGRPGDEEIAEAVGMTGGAMEQMYRLLAIAKYNERYVIPKAHVEQAHNLEEMGCSVNFD